MILSKNSPIVHYLFGLLAHAMRDQQLAILHFETALKVRDLTNVNIHRLLPQLIYKSFVFFICVSVISKRDLKTGYSLNLFFIGLTGLPFTSEFF